MENIDTGVPKDPESVQIPMDDDALMKDLEIEEEAAAKKASQSQNEVHNETGVQAGNEDDDYQVGSETSEDSDSGFEDSYFVESVDEDEGHREEVNMEFFDDLLQDDVAESSRRQNNNKGKGKQQETGSSCQRKKGGRPVRKKRNRKEHDEEQGHYESEELLSGSEEDEDPPRRFPSFNEVPDLTDFKWEVGTLFGTKDEFKDAIKTYAVHSGRDLKFEKNDSYRVRVRCKEGCVWEAYLFKLPNEATWQLRKIVDNHTCSREYRVRMLSSRWLSKDLVEGVKENHLIRLTDIQNRVQSKWNSGITKTKASRARRMARDKVDGSFKEQYYRLYDYCHNLLKSNPGSTVKLLVDSPHVDQTVVDIAAEVNNPIFKRLYM